MTSHPYDHVLRNQSMDEQRTISKPLSEAVGASSSSADASTSTTEASRLAQSVLRLSAIHTTLCAVLLGSAFYIGIEPGVVLADSALNDIIELGGSQNTLSKQDLEILRALEASSNPKSKKSALSKPVVQRPGEVRFVYGAARPTIVCSLLHVCDIALEPGETVVDVQSGDSARWVVGRSAHGTPLGMVEHVTLKPTDIGLESNLTIYTDKRSYSMDIKSSAKDFMPSVSFIYTEQSLERYRQVKDELLRRQQYNELDLDDGGVAGIAAADDYTMSDAAALPKGVARGRSHGKGNSSVAMLSGLDFNYKITGDKEIIPLRVFNDGKHTYVQMPKHLMEGMLPALVEVTQTHVFSDDATAVTNYRVNGNNFVVDGIPRHLRLFIGNKDSGRALSADIVRNS